jgi:Bifunctional DNA primase/polymerase, N-terminal/Primase C terminal 1 (PriCT-1)
MSFRDWQPRYAAHGIATFPVRVCDDGKVPAIRGWQRVGLPGSATLAQRFADADAFGFCAGQRSGLTILDVDTNDERTLADALDHHGHTQIIVRSGSGNYQAWYRWNGEKRQIRPDSEKPIDILGGGFVVAPPSRGINSNYQFIEGGLGDLDHLPVLRSIETPPSPLSSASIPNEALTEGGRNNTLWRHCMRSARYCDNLDALLDVARTRNEDFLPPLTESEVVKTARSAWDYTQRGQNRFGRPGVFFEAKEATDLICSDPDAFMLLAFLLANNGPASTFMAANGLAEPLGWSRKRLARTRRRLEGAYIKMVRRPTTFKGPAMYRWVPKDGQN